MSDMDILEALAEKMPEVNDKIVERRTLRALEEILMRLDSIESRLASLEGRQRTWTMPDVITSPNTANPQIYHGIDPGQRTMDLNMSIDTTKLSDEIHKTMTELMQNYKFEALDEDKTTHFTNVIS